MSCFLYVLMAFSIASPLACAAQNNANHWYFGLNAGIVFDEATITATSGPMHTAEGCASISDGCGLLFYTDGDTVWNKDQVMMANGFGLGGQCTGHVTQSSTQAALILRQPGNDSLFYVFTTDCHEDQLVNGLRYSIVNMAKMNGLGEVILKDQYLHAPVDEKLTGVKHANGCDLWVITHEYGTDAFYAFLLTENGLNPIPVVSHAGQPHTGDPEYDNCVRGYLKASPDGSKLISVTPDGVYWYCDSILPELFSVDQAAGLITSDFTFPGDTDVVPYYDSWAIPFYGATFSPDGSKLYLSSGFYGPHLFQYDLAAGSVADILASKTLLNDSLLNAFSDPCALQTGPDGKIYVAHEGSSFLGVINEPDQPGFACNYIDSAVALLPSTRNDWGGLPNFFEPYTQASPLRSDFNYSVTEVALPMQFMDGSEGADTYFWDFGDGGTSTAQNPLHIYLSEGPFTVTLTVKDVLCNLDKTCQNVLVPSSTGIQAISDQPIPVAYPNPFQHATTLEMKNRSDAVLEIHNPSGALVYQRYIDDNRQTPIYLGQSLQPGVYVLTILLPTQVITSKLIKLQ